MIYLRGIVLAFLLAAQSAMSGPSSPSALAYNPVLSAPTYGGQCSDGPSSSASMSCAINAAAGDTLVVIMYQYAAISSVTDSLGASPVLISSQGTNGPSAYYSANVAAGTHTITTTFSSAASYPAMQVIDVHGAAASSPIDTYSYTYISTSTTAIASASVTTTLQNELLIGSEMAAAGGADVITPSGSPLFTNVSGAFQDQTSAYYSTSSVGTYIYQATSNSAYAWWVWLIAVKP